MKTDASRLSHQLSWTIELAKKQTQTLSVEVESGMKKMAVIGSAGAGKSSLCNIFAGKRHDDDTFPVGDELTSCTYTTSGKTGTNCIKIGLPGKSILRDYFQENRTSQRPVLY